MRSPALPAFMNSVVPVSNIRVLAVSAPAVATVPVRSAPEAMLNGVVKVTPESARVPVPVFVKPPVPVIVTPVIRISSVARMLSARLSVRGTFPSASVPPAAVIV